MAHLLEENWRLKIGRREEKSHLVPGLVILFTFMLIGLCCVDWVTNVLVIGFPQNDKLLRDKANTGFLFLSFTSSQIV